LLEEMRRKLGVVKSRVRANGMEVIQTAREPS
jgi:hypothetical protein